MEVLKKARKLQVGDKIKVRCLDVALRLELAEIEKLGTCTHLLDHLPCRNPLVCLDHGIPQCRSPLVITEEPRYCLHDIQCCMPPDIRDFREIREIFVAAAAAGAKIKVTTEYEIEILEAAH